MRRIVIDGAVPEPVCAHLVASFQANIGRYGRKNKVDFWSFRLINAHELPGESELRTTMGGIGQLVIDSISREWGEPAAIQASQLVCWPAGTSQEAHLDRFFPDTRFAAIVYLNADYSGGATFFEESGGTERVRPRTGRMLIFEGQLVMHGVEQIHRGTRYTNALWLA